MSLQFNNDFTFEMNYTKQNETYKGVYQVTYTKLFLSTEDFAMDFSMKASMDFTKMTLVPGEIALSMLDDDSNYSEMEFIKK